MVSIVADGRFGTAGDRDAEPNIGASARFVSGGFVSVFRLSNDAIKAQLYDAAGQPVGGLIEVSASGMQPDVAVLTSGGWAVVWNTVSGDQVRSAVFDANGARVAPDTAVSAQASAPFESVGNPHVSTGANDSFTVNWNLSTPVGSASLNLRVVDGGNTPLTPTLVVRSGPGVSGDTTTLADGRELIVTGARDQDGNSSRIKVAIFDASANRVTDDNFVNISSTAANVFRPELTQLADGRLLVSWTEYFGGSNYVMRGGLYDANGTALGQEFTRPGILADVAALDDGGFVVAGNTFGDAPLVQVFDAAAQPLGAAFSAFDTNGRSPQATVLTPFGTNDFGVYVSYRDSATGVADTAFRTYQSVTSGTAGADVIVGTPGFDIIKGLAGDDRLSGLGGDDLLIGGAGADRLDGGAGFDTISYEDSDAAVAVNLATGAAVGGTASGDVLVSIESVVGSSFDDALIGDGGANRLEGGGGNDRLVGLGGADVLVGGSGVDLVDYSASAAGVRVGLLGQRGEGGDAAGDTLFEIENLRGSAFNDILGGSIAANRLEGLAGDDVLLGSVNADILDGGEGRDEASYAGSANRVVINLAAGTVQGGDAQGDTLISIENVSGSNQNDTLNGDAGANLLNGLAGDDLLAGQGGDDTLNGGAGADALFGNAGMDILSGGDGNDYLDGQEDGDFILGGAGNDRLFGGTGVDLLGGEDGNDELHGGADGDNLYGGAGSDVILGEDGDDFIDGQQDGDFILGGAGNDRLYGGGGVDLLGGEDGDDQLFGGANSDNLYGGGGADAVFGEDGDDFLFGGAGSDILGGNGGSDRMGGGDGADTFLYFSTLDSSTIGGGADVIADFLSDTDKIDLSAIDANVTAAGDQAFNFIGVNNQGGPAGTLRIGFIQNVGIFLFGDTDDVLGADLIINVGTFALQGADFVL